MKHTIQTFLVDRPHKRGTVVNERYQIESVLGMGSYGITYIAKDLIENTLYALKQVKPSRRRSNQAKVSYAYEKRLLSMIKHPQIPAIYDTFIYKNNEYIAMDFINGNTFEDLIFRQENVYNELSSFQILKEVLEVVTYLHRLGIVHRDLRIPNILYHEAKIYIIDFGLARIMDESTNEKLPTIRYSDEHILKRELHPRSDFYALGHFVLFLLYSGFTPQTNAEGSWEQELCIAEPSRLMIRKLLQIDRPYQTIEELNRDLEELLQYLQYIEQDRYISFV